MSIEARRVGSATLGLPDEPGLPVLYDITLEHDGASLIAFAGAVRSVGGGSLRAFQGQEVVLRIEDGPAVEVTIAEMDGEQAILALTHPDSAL